MVIDKDVQFTDTSGLLVLLRSTKGFSLATAGVGDGARAGSESTILPVDDLGAMLTTYLSWRNADTRLDPVVDVLRRARDPQRTGPVRP